MKVPLAHVKAVHRYLLDERGTGADWFAPGASRFFGTTYPRTAHTYDQGYLFVTGEADHYGSSPRRYTVRFQDRRGWIHTVGDFQQYGTRREAEAAMTAMLAAERQSLAV